MNAPAMAAIMDVEHFEAEMTDKGWVVIEGFVDQDLVARMLTDLASAYRTCRALQVKNRVSLDTEGTLHHLIGQGDSFLELIDRLAPVVPHLERYFQGKFILNSLGGNILEKRASYANAVHRDIRTYSGAMPLLLNTLVMLDEFTPENGATFLMSGSHRSHPDKPTDAAFYAGAVQAVGPAGSLLVFNSNLWHAAGVNTTDRPRRSITPMFCRPFMKAQFDYPRALGYDRMGSLSELQRQILGYYSRIPASLEEWYQPAEHRMYRPGQG